MDTFPENTTSKKGFSMKGKLAWLKNKYLLSSFLFLIWMLFFDPKDVGSAFNRWHKFNELKTSEEQLTKQIITDQLNFTSKLISK